MRSLQRVSRLPVSHSHLKLVHPDAGVDGEAPPAQRLQGDGSRDRAEELPEAVDSHVGGELEWRTSPTKVRLCESRSAAFADPLSASSGEEGEDLRFRLYRGCSPR